MKRLSLIFLCLLALQPAHAESRTWRNTDASSSFEGTYVSHDKLAVTIRRADGQVFTLGLDKLHAADRAWLAALGPDGAPEAAPPPNAIFDHLCFGDSRQKVEDKLKNSRMVEPIVGETFLGRFGLNGTFRTRAKIGGLHCELYFDWTEGGRLKEISLQTPPQGRDAYDSSMKENWAELTELLTQLHGRPLQAVGYPQPHKLENDMFLGSHLWRIQGGGSALLGTSMVAGKYLVVVRFTAERIDPRQVH